jgi:hypothetical protein
MLPAEGVAKWGVGGLSRLYDVTVTYGNGSLSCDLCKLFNFIEDWWAQQDSNLRLPPCEGGTLPLSYAPDSPPKKLKAMASPFKLCVQNNILLAAIQLAPDPGQGNPGWFASA